MHRRKLILTGRWQYFKNQSYRPFIKSSKRKVPALNLSLVSGNTSSTQKCLTSTASGPTPTTPGSTSPTSTCSMSADYAQGGGSDQSPCQMDIPTSAQFLPCSKQSDRYPGGSSMQCLGGASSTSPCHPVSQSGPAKDCLNVGDNSTVVGYQSFSSLLPSSTHISHHHQPLVHSSSVDVPESA